MASESLQLDFRSALIEAVKEQRTALVCAIAVGALAIGAFHGPAKPVLLGCGGAVTLLVFWGCVKRFRK